MKFSKSLLASAIVLTLTQSATANWTTSAVIKNETAVFSNSGSVTGNFTPDALAGVAPTQSVTKGTAISHSSGDTLKSETSARIFMNGEFDNGNTAHIELRPVYDSEAANSDYEAHQDYTQQDFLREAYVDTTTEDGTYLRIGKQQIVWGKADGAKFLDLINPTDYREMAQNSMDESRVTVWGLNAEKILDDGSTVQVTLTQPKENLFAGLNRNIDTVVRGNNANGTDETLNNGHDEGHPFVLMGPDSITGRQNGFLNIVPDLGSVAMRFAGAFGVGGAGLGGLNSPSFTGFTVGSSTAGFGAISMAGMAAALGGADFYDLPGGTGAAGAAAAAANPYASYGGFAQAVYGVADCLDDGTCQNVSLDVTNAADVTTINAITGTQMLEYGFAPYYNTNLADYEMTNAAAPGATQVQDSTFDYMQSTTFITFDSFVNAKSQYIYDMPDDFELDLGMKWSKSLDNGMNVSFAYSYNYDKNPIINTSWRSPTGTLLYANRANMAVGADGNPGTADDYMVYNAAGGSLILTDQQGDVGSNWSVNAQADGGAAADYDANNYGGAAQQAGDANAYGILRFEQTVERVNNFGTAFDYAVDTEGLGPVVLRGEFVYTKDGYQPVMDKDLLAIGDLVGALTMQKADRFKYVLGADVTVLTDMMLSAQFIQERNLDFVDNANRYTTSYASMHMSNGFIKDIENKEFYSLFLSKPFGESGEGRWNNILMVEEGGGRWNRFDVEYSLSNEVVGTFEVNKYWGDANSQFGQLENSSNVQVGLKYIIE